MKPYRLYTSLLAACLLAAMLATVSPQQVAHGQDIECAVPAPAAEPPIPEWISDLRRIATGTGVKVAVIDTGVAPHPQLDQLAPGPDYITPGAPEPLKDCDVHGTVVAGIIAGQAAGIAPDAEILSIRQSSSHYRQTSPDTSTEDGDVTTSNTLAGAGNLETLTHAITAAVDAGAHVINISVVSCVEPSRASRVDTNALEAALYRAESAGAVVVAAAGNVNNTCPPGSTVYPAHFPTVVTVGARADSHTVAEYTLPVPDDHPMVSAPGQLAFALAPGNAGWSAGLDSSNGTIQPFEGTSFAAPVVTGTVALLRQRHPDANPAQIRELIYAAAQPGGGAVDPWHTVTFVPDTGKSPPHTVQLEPADELQRQAPARSAKLMAIFVVLAGLALAAAGAISIARGKQTTRRSGMLAH